MVFMEEAPLCPSLSFTPGGASLIDTPTDCEIVLVSARFPIFPIPEPVTGLSQILRRICRPHWYEIIELIKCSKGLSVGELAAALDMSYMGVKKHCVAMEKLGYLDTWRRPKTVGRPEKIYRLTKRLDPLFPGIGNEVCLSLLDAAGQFDPNAAEKMLYAYFLRRTGELLPLVEGGGLAERAEKLAAERRKQGYQSRFVAGQDERVDTIDEFHNPLEPLFERFPTVVRMEVQMFEKLLRTRVERSRSVNSGLILYRFALTSRS